MFHQVLAEIPLVSFCKVFTNKRDLLFFIHFILRGIPLAFFLSKLFLPGVVYNVQVLIFSLQPLSWHFACLRHIINELLSSLPEHCQCFPREDVSPIFSLGSVREIHSLGKYFSVHSLGHSEYQEIHTFSALNIDSVKINTSLLMMRECIHTLPRGGMYRVVHPWRQRDFLRPERCPEGFALGTSQGPREISWSSGMYNPFSHH